MTDEPWSGAHYDTQLEGPRSRRRHRRRLGARACPRLARRQTRRTIVLAAFAVEEPRVRLLEPRRRLRQEEKERTVGMVNLDALGLPFPGA